MVEAKQQTSKNQAASKATCSSETSTGSMDYTALCLKKTELFITTALRTSNPTSESKSHLSNNRISKQA
jgi:hypothetical protein